MTAIWSNGYVRSEASCVSCSWGEDSVTVAVLA